MWGSQIIPGVILLLSALSGHPEVELLVMPAWLPQGLFLSLPLRDPPEAEPLLRQQVSSSGDLWHSAAPPGSGQPSTLGAGMLLLSLSP